jgi:hypothetical protein
MSTWISDECSTSAIGPRACWLLTPPTPQSPQPHPRFPKRAHFTLTRFGHERGISLMLAGVWWAGLWAR